MTSLLLQLVSKPPQTFSSSTVTSSTRSSSTASPELCFRVLWALCDLLRAHLLPWATSCSPKTAGYQPYQLEAGAGDPVAGRDPLPAPSPTCTYNGVPWSFTSWARLRGRRGQRPSRQRRACCPRLRQPAVAPSPDGGRRAQSRVITDDWILSQVVFDEDAEAPIPAAVLQIEDGPPLEEAVVPPNQAPSSISPTVPFVALQIEDQAVHPAAHPEPAQSWSLTWDQFDQLLGSGSQATPPDFGRLDFDSSRLGIWIFNPFLMLIGDLNLPELTDLSTPCLRMSLFRIFPMMEKMTPLKISPLLKLQVRPNPRRANGRLRIGRK